MLTFIVGVLIFAVVMASGVLVLRALARPMPPPPPVGELRKVNLRYRCTICGMELKLTAAAEEDPDPPRHCLEEMQLVAPVE